MYLGTLNGYFARESPIETYKQHEYKGGRYRLVSQKIVLGGFVIESTSGCFANWTIRALHSTKYTKCAA